MLQDTLERVLELSRADACIAIAWHHSSANLRWALNTTTTNGVSDSQELFVLSVIDGRVGSVGRTYFPDESLESLVRESEAACEGKPPAEDLMPLLEGDGFPEDWPAPPELTNIGVFAKVTPDLAAAFARAEEGGYLLFGFAEHEQTTVYLATSTGLRRRHSGAEGKFQINAKTPDFKASTWAGLVTTTFQDVDVEAMERKLAERLEWSKNPVPLPAGRYEVLLEPSCVADLVLEAYWSSAARDADEGRSVFSRPGGGNLVGKSIAPEGISLYSDPAEPGFEVSPFVVTTSSSSYSSVFDNGLSSGRIDWITRGVLTGMITTRYWAKTTGVEPKPFLENLIFPSEGPSLDEMIASTKRALLVTCLWYIREVDPQTLLLTGLTRDGVFLVEDGRVIGAVNNFRFNMSPLDMLAQATEIGRSESTLA
ncbi:MAG TPA: metallopeptidase TldD-related protein, partial [Actinomycetota bacterium]|nr:metallopeptidase TldD-related protein [Actinomycetota bacterium]